jgi:hypothetical protein
MGELAAQEGVPACPPRQLVPAAIPGRLVGLPDRGSAAGHGPLGEVAGRLVRPRKADLDPAGVRGHGLNKSV